MNFQGNCVDHAEMGRDIVGTFQWTRHSAHGVGTRPGTEASTNASPTHYERFTVQNEQEKWTSSFL